MWRQRFRSFGNKFGNTKTIFKNEHFDSKFEAQYSMFLESEKSAGRILDFKKHVPIELIVHGDKITTYYADFVVTHRDLSEEVIECKGFFTDYARLKWKLFNAIFKKEHPDVKIKMEMLMTKWPRRAFKNGSRNYRQA